MTLERVDIIYTGTPSGTALSFSSDLKYLKLLPPFDAMAESNYECVDDYDKEKLRGVRKFFAYN